MIDKTVSILEGKRKERGFGIKEIVIVICIFLSGFLIRLYHITDPPLDFQPIRQYQMAHIARGMYYEGLDSVPQWKMEIVEINKERIGFLLEPRILEHIVVFLYRVAGGEALWIPRVISSIFWIIGGIFLYLVARNLFGSISAFISLTFYLFLPFSIPASRSFQPDSLMMMLTLMGIYGITRYIHNPNLTGLIITSAISSIAILIKPYSVFPVYGAFISLMTYKNGFRSLIKMDSIIFFLISIAPGSLYYLSGILFGKGLIKEHTQVTFLPHLLLKPYFYKDWLAMIGRVVGWTAFLIGIGCLFIIKEQMQRSLLIGLWIGYLIFGFLFTYHIHTHDYYQLFLIPIVSLSVAGIGYSLMNRYQDLSWVIVVVLSLVAFAGYPFYKQGRDLNGLNRYIAYLTGSNPYIYSFFKGDYDKTIRMYKEIGEAVGHSKETVFLTSDFGRSLTYHGWISGLPWPTSESLRERQEVNIPIPDKSEILNIEYLTIRTHGRYIKYKPEYFIVIDLKEFEKQRDLRDFLNSNFPLMVDRDDFLIYDLTKMKEAGNG